MEPLEFILVANGPGELASFVKPIVEKIRSKTKKSNRIRISLFITPCQFSSGREMEYANSLGLDQVITADEYRKWILGIQTNQPYNFVYRGVVLYLGGDLLHAVLIAKKLGYKVYAYLHGQKIGWQSIFSKFFVLSEKTQKKLHRSGLENERIKVVGDLMLNSQKVVPKKEVIKTWHLNPDKPIIAFLPGSRSWEINYMIPFYETIAMELKKIISGIQLMLVVSPFTPIEEVEKKSRDNLFDAFVPLSSITPAKLAVSIPGTNNAQIASFGIPLLMLLPLNKINEIPLEGTLNYLTKVPLIGIVIKRIAAEIICCRTKFFSLPNIKAHKMIVPELKGRISPELVVEKILELLNNTDKLNQISENLKKAMGESNAAEMIVGDILNENLPAPLKLS